MTQADIFDLILVIVSLSTPLLVGWLLYKLIYKFFIRTTSSRLSEVIFGELSIAIGIALPIIASAIIWGYLPRLHMDTPDFVLAFACGFGLIQFGFRTSRKKELLEIFLVNKTLCLSGAILFLGLVVFLAYSFIYYLANATTLTLITAIAGMLCCKMIYAFGKCSYTLYRMSSQAESYHFAVQQREKISAAFSQRMNSKDIQADEVIINYVRNIWYSHFPQHKVAPLTLIYDPLLLHKNVVAGLCHISHDSSYDHNGTDNHPDDQILFYQLYDVQDFKTELENQSEIECLLICSMTSADIIDFLLSKLKPGGVVIVLDDLFPIPDIYQKLTYQVHAESGWTAGVYHDAHIVYGRYIVSDYTHELNQKLLDVTQSYQVYVKPLTMTVHAKREKM